MSKSIKTLLAISLVSFVAACGGQTEEVIIIDEPIVAEPTMSKY